MKTLMSIFVFLMSCNLMAHETKVSFSKAELMKNRIVVRGDNDIAVADRVIQLQLKAAGCEGVIVLSQSLEFAEMNHFSVNSYNCVIKSKDESCDSGFNARNMPENPHASGSGIIGLDTHRICIKSVSGGGASEPTQK